MLCFFYYNGEKKVLGKNVNEFETQEYGIAIAELVKGIYCNGFSIIDKFIKDLRLRFSCF